MIGFAIMMWFVSLVLLIVGLSLRNGNYSMIHGKKISATENKTEYAKALSTPLLTICAATAISSVVAIITNKIEYAVMLIVLILLVEIAELVLLQKKF